jgi:hypothetical protein
MRGMIRAHRYGNIMLEPEQQGWGGNPPSCAEENLLSFRVLDAEIENGQSSASTIRRRLGSGRPEISALGLGCFGLSNAYGHADDSESIRTIQRS